MALDVLELGVIALMAIGVFVWGPDKVPQIAKQIASARKQLDVYTKQLQGVTKELQTSMTTGNIDNLGNVLSNIGIGAQPAASAPNAPPGSLAAQAGKAGVTATIASSTVMAPVAPGPGQLPVPKPTTLSSDELLIEMARKLGISAQGKTRDELQTEIVQRSMQPADVPPVEPAQATAPAVEQAPIQGADLV